MPDYSKTWFYYIQIGKDKRYYGHSTNQYVSRYETTHRSKYKRALEKGDFTRKLWKDFQDAGMKPEDIKLTLIEHYACKDANEARMSERYWCELYDKKKLSNSVRPIITKDELKELKRKYKRDPVWSKEYRHKYYVKNLNRLKIQ